MKSCTTAAHKSHFTLAILVISCSDAHFFKRSETLVLNGQEHTVWLNVEENQQMMVKEVSSTQTFHYSALSNAFSSQFKVAHKGKIFF